MLCLVYGMWKSYSDYAGYEKYDSRYEGNNKRYELDDSADERKNGSNEQEYI